jgi:hypothetical protein
MLGYWDPYLSVGQNIERIQEENRVHIIETRRQIDSIRATLGILIKKIEETEARAGRLESTLCAEKHSGFGQINPGHCLPFSPPIKPPSPAPTLYSEISNQNGEEIELRWDIASWVGDTSITHPFRSRIPKPLSVSSLSDSPISRISNKQMLHHVLPANYNPRDLVHSPYGRADVTFHLTPEQQQKLVIRCLDSNENTMGLIGKECEAFPVQLGGLNEPLIAGRFPDEPDLRRAHSFRLQRWATHTDLRLHRLPRRAILLPNDSIDVPDHVLVQRRRTWYLTYRIWYRFISMVGPSRFPGLLDESWELILGEPPEETSSILIKALGAYTGYAGTSAASGSEFTRLQSIIPDLLHSFDAAVRNPWPGHASLADLIIDLDEFEAQREFEARDATYLWRGVLWNTFPKHCMKHLRTKAVGGSDSRWAVVQAEFTERLAGRSHLWREMAKYRFCDSYYVPNGRECRKFDRNQRLKQLVHESLVFSQLLVCWKDGPLYLHAARAELTSMFHQTKPLDDIQLERWITAAHTVEIFYEQKSGRAPVVPLGVFY